MAKKYYGLTGGKVKARESSPIDDERSAIAFLPTQSKIIRLSKTPSTDQPFLMDGMNAADAQIRGDLAQGPRKKDTTSRY